MHVRDAIKLAAALRTFVLVTSTVELSILLDKCRNFIVTLGQILIGEEVRGNINMHRVRSTPADYADCIPHLQPTHGVRGTHVRKDGRECPIAGDPRVEASEYDNIQSSESCTQGRSSNCQWRVMTHTLGEGDQPERNEIVVILVGGQWDIVLSCATRSL